MFPICSAVQLLKRFFSHGRILQGLPECPTNNTIPPLAAQISVLATVLMHAKLNYVALVNKVC
jgi:hypothetical protein